MTNPFRNDGSWFGIEVLFVSPTPTHPQDHGNRKRFFELCSELKRQGAKVHYVHYASEHDWRFGRPARHEREMIDTWDSYQLVAPTRPLHEASVGEDHLIDEWADPALTNYIRWAFRVYRYDVVIVAYTWMTFCFEGVPEGVFKISDPNDVFGNRRQLLAANGIAPEFFHTTPAEEAKGLARADLVWAIKESEQRYYEKDLELKHCLTMLYAESDKGWWKGPPSTDGWLRAGVIGARNNVNRRNLEAFLEVALPIFVSYMAPIKIVIAGGCADDFRDHRHPNLEVIGRVPDVADFYRDMDVVCAPMQFSTGLKIKVAEALASGAPLIAHAHAMEGYPEGHKFHVLPTFRAMADEMVKLAFDRSGLTLLAARSRSTNARINAMVLNTLEETRRQFVGYGSKTVCVVAPVEALDPRGVLYDHLYATLNYLRFATRIVLHLVGKPAKVNPDILRSHGFDLRVFLDPELAAASGNTLPESWVPLDLESVLRTRGIDRCYFLTQVPDLESLEIIGADLLRRAYLRYDAIELSGYNPMTMIEALRPVTSLVVLSAAIAGLGPEFMVTGVEAITQVPFRRKNAFSSLSRRLSAAGRWYGLLVIGDPADPLAEGLRQLATRFELSIAFLDVHDADLLQSVVAPSDGAVHQANIVGARLVVDIDAAGSGMVGVLVEGARRAGVPVVRLVRGPAATILHQNPRIARPATVGALFQAVARGIADADFRQLLIEEAQREAGSLAHHDAGWTWLWQDLTRDAKPKQTKAATELLFG
jgi:glycosyltransferase involved in cell wall biosynthesis